MARGHSYISPSKFDRLIRCPGSLAACEGLPEPEPTPEAEEGTRAHELAESWLVLDYPPPCDDDEMLEAIGFYVRECQSLPGLHLIERRLSLNGIAPIRGQFGICDFIAIHDGILDVIDLKYGMGVLVDAIENKQLACYGMAALNEYGAAHNIKRVRLRIIQPRREHVSTWDLTPAELAEFTDAVRPDIGRALHEHALRIPGRKQCQFCAAAPTCPEKAQDVKNAMTRALIGEDLPLQEKADLAACAEIIASSIKAWKAQIRVSLEIGDDIQGWEISPGVQRRAWIDERKVIAALGDAAYKPRSIISPAAAEKLSSIVDLSENIIYKRSSGGVRPTR